MSSSTEDIQLAPVVDVYLQCLIQLKVVCAPRKSNDEQTETDMDRRLNRFMDQ